MMYGISKEQYERILEIQKLQAFYGFEDVISQIIVEFSDAKGIPLRDAFKYAEERGFLFYQAPRPTEKLIELLAMDYGDEKSDFAILIKNENEEIKEKIKNKYRKKYNIPLNPTSEQLYQICRDLGYADCEIPIYLLPDELKKEEIRKILFDDNEYYLYFICGLSCLETFEFDWDEITGNDCSEVDLSEYSPAFIRAFVRNNSKLKFNVLYKRYQYFTNHFFGTGNPTTDAAFEKEYLMLIAANIYPEGAFALALSMGRDVSFDIDQKLTDIPLDELRRRLIRLDDISRHNRVDYPVHDYDYSLDEDFYGDYGFENDEEKFTPDI